ncbi:hypothetical protein [Mycolicibacterium doricum]|uniref:Uncharacterized protein n=1 Tax=Mycolicibacterium doricum TaxID=126673 RepID=A0A1X1SXZ0_9MYCO|nr:hypothetical protein [Mycolicibacterium doricum]MCV7269019.1 hypothetical protein [Mycolicibacterium doricum]ORV36041.1 hypothetical protein AWC01_17505 [Mycolicibacterium doricum]
MAKTDSGEKIFCGVGVQPLAGKTKVHRPRRRTHDDGDIDDVADIIDDVADIVPTCSFTC